MSDGQVDVPDVTTTPQPQSWENPAPLTEGQRARGVTERRALPPVPAGHVALEIDWSYDEDDATDPDAPSLEFLLETQAAEWHVSLEILHERGPGGLNPVVRLSGPPANVALALLRYNGAGQVFDVRTFKWVEQPAFSDARAMFSSVYDFTTGAPAPFSTSALDASDGGNL
jgi:hypothetical protein